MNRQEILDNIKEQFKKMMNFADAPATATFTTKDGKNIVVMGEDLSVGCEIYLLDDKNIQTPLDNGEYEITDGRKIKVTDSKIEDIMAPDPAQAVESPVEPASIEMENGMTGEMPSEGEAETETETTDYEARISAMEQQIQEILQMLQGTMEQTEKMMSSHIEMSQKVKEIANEPDGEKPKVGKKMIQDKQTYSSTTMDEIRELQRKLGSIKSY